MKKWGIALIFFVLSIIFFSGFLGGLSEFSILIFLVLFLASIFFSIYSLAKKEGKIIVSISIIILYILLAIYSIKIIYATSSF